MSDPFALGIPALALAMGIVVPLLAWRARGRLYAAFALVLLVLSLPGLVVSHARLADLADLAGPAAAGVVGAVFTYGIAAVGIHLVHLMWARLRRAPFRYLVSVPGQMFVAAGFLSAGWLLLLLPLRGLLYGLDQGAALAFLRPFDLVPFAVALGSLVTSTRPVPEWVRVRLGGGGPEQVERVPVERYRRSPPAPLAVRPLRIVQISDPHLGPWQTVARLRRSIEQLLAHDPDLVLLTGDFLTMEGAGSPGALTAALAPLREVSSRCYAIFGNHDHEAPDQVREALAAHDVRLLIDEEIVTETPIGPVQILGADYVGRNRREHIEGLLARHPRRGGHLRLVLLHDPLGFQHVPDGAADLVLSGHTHGGQVGLVSLGLDWTVLSRSRWPDHGLFAQGSNRLYVHRGTGFYGFPLRVGVPGEHSVLELVLG